MVHVTFPFEGKEMHVTRRSWINQKQVPCRLKQVLFRVPISVIDHFSWSQARKQKSAFRGISVRTQIRNSHSPNRHCNVRESHVTGSLLKIAKNWKNIKKSNHSPENVPTALHPVCRRWKSVPGQHAPVHRPGGRPPFRRLPRLLHLEHEPHLRHCSDLPPSSISTVGCRDLGYLNDRDASIPYAGFKEWEASEFHKARTNSDVLNETASPAFSFHVLK